MKHLIFFLSFYSFFSINTLAGQNLSERLGYDKDAKLLIIHADDLGVAHSENKASIIAMEKGAVNSASIMVPCPWFPEIAEHARQHPELDLGLHLTLTSEWKHLKWGPSAKPSEVASLLNEQGYFYDNCTDFAKNAKLEEVETELRAQIDRAIAFGIQPTHLDSHMGCLFFQSPDIFAIYLKLGREYKLPTLVGRATMERLPAVYSKLLTETDIVLNKAIVASPENYASGMAKFYEKELRSLEPGVSIILLHAAFDNEEMQAVTIDHPDYGAHWRQQDFDFFTSKDCTDILKEEGIRLVTWKQIKALLK